MARTLWDDMLSFEDLAADYFASAFGPAGARVQAYLGRLAELIDFGWLKNLDGMEEGEVQHRCRSALEVIRRFLPAIQSGLADPQPVHRQSWQVLFHHAQATRQLVKILQARVQGRESRVESQWQALKQYACQHEDELQPALDVWAFDTDG